MHRVRVSNRRRRAFWGGRCSKTPLPWRTHTHTLGVLLTLWREKKKKKEMVRMKTREKVNVLEQSTANALSSTFADSSIKRCLTSQTETDVKRAKETISELLSCKLWWGISLLLSALLRLANLSVITANPLNPPRVSSKCSIYLPPWCILFYYASNETGLCAVCDTGTFILIHNSNKRLTEWASSPWYPMVIWSNVF